MHAMRNVTGGGQQGMQVWGEQHNTAHEHVQRVDSRRLPRQACDQSTSDSGLSLSTPHHLHSCHP